MTRPRLGRPVRASALAAGARCTVHPKFDAAGAWAAAWPLVRGDLGLTYVQVGVLLSAPHLFGNVVEPAQAASSVLTASWGTRLSAASSEPGLKPNQPMKSTMAPSTTNGTLWPGMARALPSLPYLRPYTPT